MLHESASSTNDRPLVLLPVEAEEKPKKRLEDARIISIREHVANILDVETENATPPTTTNPNDTTVAVGAGQVLVTFIGRLRLDSEPAYAQLDAQLKPMDLLPVFRVTDDNKHLVMIVDGRAKPKPRGWWLNAVLFVVTLLSVLLVGTEMAINEMVLDVPPAERDNLPPEILQMAENPWLELWRGLPYAVSILLILGAHELGHYFAARRHNLAVTLPYFIPFPLNLIGTFGAFIQLREPIRNRKVLLDVGAAGPLAGLVFAVPILLIGLATSPIGQPGRIIEGNSILYALAKYLQFGEFLPSATRDVFVNQLTWAGWTGLLVTGWNLIPLGQLDGGHIMYALFGKWARLLYYPIIGIVALLSIATGGTLLLLLMLVFLGRVYAVPLDDITVLDNRRRAIAFTAIVVFFLTFVPVPLTVVPPPTTPRPTPGNPSVYLPFVALGLVYIGQIGRWLQGRAIR